MVEKKTVEKAKKTDKMEEGGGFAALKLLVFDKINKFKTLTSVPSCEGAEGGVHSGCGRRLSHF